MNRALPSHLTSTVLRWLIHNFFFFSNQLLVNISKINIINNHKTVIGKYSSTYTQAQNRQLECRNVFYSVTDLPTMQTPLSLSLGGLHCHSCIDRTHTFIGTKQKFIHTLKICSALILYKCTHKHTHI